MDSKQTGYAKTIIGEVKRRNLPKKAAVIAIECALTESGIYVYANKNVPQSMNYPHDKVGSDHASVGIFQQQPQFWGTVRDCMDPLTSARKFLDALGHTNWPAMPNWIACQTVQRSAFSDGSNYKRNDAEANTIVNQLWGSATGTAPAKPGTPGTKPPHALRVDYFGRNHNARVADVKVWQARMRERGWKAGGVLLAADGIYGPKSESVCKSFQTEKGLVKDGLVGPKTWNASWTAPIT